MKEDSVFVKVWEDVFEGDRLDENKWIYYYGGGPNNELQNYTDSQDNVRVEHKLDLDNKENQLLVLEAHCQDSDHNGVKYGYTSGRINSKGKFSITYGKIEMRAKLPFGQGIWPAFWMLGDDIGTVGWPACGEIDIMEYIGTTPNATYGTVHGPGYSGAAGLVKRNETCDTLSTKFHTYGIEWEPGEIRWYFDGQHFHTVKPDHLEGQKWVFDHPFYIILNLAVGGDWPGNPDATTVFPQQYLVDYVRVFDLKLN